MEFDTSSVEFDDADDADATTNGGSSTRPPLAQLPEHDEAHAAPRRPHSADANDDNDEDNDDNDDDDVPLTAVARSERAATLVAALCDDSRRLALVRSSSRSNFCSVRLSVTIFQLLLFLRAFLHVCQCSQMTHMAENRSPNAVLFLHAVLRYDKLSVTRQHSQSNRSGTTNDPNSVC